MKSWKVQSLKEFKITCKTLNNFSNKQGPSWKNY